MRELPRNNNKKKKLRNERIEEVGLHELSIWLDLSKIPPSKFVRKRNHRNYNFLSIIVARNGETH